MRQNLTNVKETQLDKVDSFYIVGSTTKEGLIEGRSNVKIDLKKAVAEGGGGGGGSEDAQKLFEMFFGQVPYVFYNGAPEGYDPSPITEYSTEELLELCATYGGILLIYKEQEPVAKAYTIQENPQLLWPSINVTVLSGELEMTLVPVDIPNGPWYYPAEKVVADIDLSNFSKPTSGNPTTLTGVEIPQKEELTVKQLGGVVTYNWNSGSNQYECEMPSVLYTIAYNEDSWVWSFIPKVG